MAKKNINFWEDLLKDMPTAYKNSLKKEETWLIQNSEKNSSVLEIGCGDGRSLEQLLILTKNLVGIDHDKTAVDLAKKKFKVNPEVKILLQNANKLKFKEKKIKNKHVRNKYNKKKYINLDTFR